jgi:hypothetical protein
MNELVDLTPMFLAELRRKQERSAWKHIRRYVYLSGAGGILIGLMIGALVYHFTR